MPRKPSGLPLRGKMNLTIHPEIRAYADELALKRRRSISQLFEDLVEAEWTRQQQKPLYGYAPQYAPVVSQPYHHRQPEHPNPSLR